jgi:hypothetical protein
MLRQARALAVRLELARRRAGAANEPTFDPTAPKFGAYDAEAAFLRDRASRRAACTTRRAGKTSAFALGILDDSWRSPDATVYYLNETRDRAKGTFWEVLKAVAEAADLPYVANEADLTLKGPRNRWIRLGGGDSKRHVNRVKGKLPPIASLYVDEAQDWRDELLRHLLSEVVPAALADREGRLTVGGVPGPVPDPEVSLWYAITQNQAWSQHGTSTGLTMWRNPHVRNPQRALADACSDLHVTEDDPTIQREFFGRWVLDRAALMFGDLDREANVYAELPRSDRWAYTSGADFGLRDLNALQILGWARDVDPRLFAIRNRAWACGPTDAAKFMAHEIRSIGRGYLGGVGDPAGGGAGVMDDIASKEGVQMEATQKSDKEFWARIVANVIRNRELVFARDDVETEALFRDLLRVQRDPRTGRLRGHTPDRVDALIYAVRSAWPHWSFRPPGPPDGDTEHARLFAKAAAA